MLDKESSDRIDLLRFPLIVGVVFIHAYSAGLTFAGKMIEPGSNFTVDFIRDFISQGLARTAVPLFFLISGYLFFLGFDLSKDKYLLKLRTRVHTLLIPFLFWNIATLLLFALAQTIPATQVYFSGNSALIASYSAADFFRAVFGINRMPISYQFWFIRDLMLLVLLSPVVYYMNRFASLFFLVSLLSFYLLGFWPIGFLKAESALFFFIGSCLASTKKSLFFLDKYAVAIIAIYLSVALIDALLIHETFYLYYHRVGILFGVVAVLSLSKFLNKTLRLRNFLLWLSGSSFFVYAAHEPLLIIMRKAAYKFLEPLSACMVLALYFIIPIFVICFLIVSHRILLIFFPKFIDMITGARQHA